MSYSRAMVLAHVAVFLMGMAGVLAEASGFEAWRTTSYRVTFGALVLFALCLKRLKDRPSNRKLLLFLVLGVVLSIHWFAFFQSIRLLGVALGSAMLGLEPLFIALAAFVFLGEKMGKRHQIAIVLSLVGFFVLAKSSGHHEQLIPGLLWSTFAIALFTLLVLANRVWVQGNSALWLTTMEMIGAIPLSWWMIDGSWLPSNQQAWAYALALGIICTGLAYGLYNMSLKVLTAPVAGLLLGLEVVYGIAGGTVLGERLSASQVLAVFLIANILVMDLIFFFRTRKPKKERARS